MPRNHPEFADRGHDVKLRRLQGLRRVLEFDVEARLFRQQEAGIGRAPLILPLGEDDHRVAAESGQPAETGFVEHRPERLHCVGGRLRAPVDAEEAEFALDGCPVVGWMLEQDLVVPAPPEQPAAVVGPGVPEHVPEIAPGHRVARLGRSERTRFFDEGGYAADIAVKPGFGGGVKSVAHGVHRVDGAMRGKQRIGMCAEHIGHFGLVLNRPVAVFASQRMHAGDDRAGGILLPDGRGDRIAPAPRLLRRGERSHAVALVAEIPRRDGIAIAQLADEVADHANLPLDRQRIGEHVDPFERRGNVHPAGHPPGHQPDHQLEIAFMRHAAEFAETLDHDRLDSGASGRGIRQRAGAETHFDEMLSAAGQRVDRLEIRPERKHPEHLKSVTGQNSEISGNHFGLPIPPHRGTGVAGPIVASDEKFGSGSKNALRFSGAIHIKVLLVS